MSKRSMAAMLKRAKRRTTPFSVSLGGETFTGTLTALPYMRWHELLAEHPPREGSDADAQWGFRVDTFWPAVFAACASFDVEVADGEVDEFLSMLTSGDVARLGMAAYVLNVGPGETGDPKVTSEDSPETEPSSSD